MSPARLLYVALPALAFATGRGVAEDVSSASRPVDNVARQTTPLDLSLGDLTRYMDPAELAKPLRDELEEIVVNGRRPEPLPERRVIPQALGAIIYAAKNPLDAWRILVPDPNFVIPERTEDDVKDPPGAFRGRILEPGAIYD